MRTRQGRSDAAIGLSGKERGAIEAFLAYIEGQVRDVEPVCADLVRKARLSLSDSAARPSLGRVVH